MMKKAFFLSILLANAWFASAQVYVEGVKLDPTNTGNYLELDPLFRSDGRCSFRVDFGQAEPRKDFISDPNGKQVDFRSLIDGLNFFYDNGWEVSQISTLDSGRRFLMKRR